ncbi:MAG: excinuclease ABC subunit UvrC [Tissierellia bacterium]|nr:excinuclease ABC subunit UvrC [Tissierellia bacterium]
MFNFELELKKLPDKPGVYLMKDKDDEIIYVGKAISLKNRVRSYFNNDKNKSPKVLAMVKRIASFEYIIVGNEVEALVLESNLIKEKKPKYNILLRDDKTYPYIKITNEKYPKLKKTRRLLNDGAKYFGPYPNAFAVNDIIDMLHEIYHIRTCNLNFDKDFKLDRPCLNYFLKRCPGPCVGLGNEDDYLKNIDEIERFLKGNTDKLIKYLNKKMLENAAELNYEIAAKYRDYLSKVNLLMQKQRITRAKEQDSDIIAIARGDRYACVQVFFMRSGKIIDNEHFTIKDDYRERPEDIVSSFMKQFYLNISYIPDEIIVEHEPEDIQTINEFLSQKKGKKVIVKKPMRGEKVELINMVKKNADEALNKYEEKMRKRERVVPLGYEIFVNLLELESVNRIEAYDISNISGVQSVGSMVVFTQGVKDSKEYRKFKIKEVEGANDYASMEEVLTRRFNRWKKDNIDSVETGFGMLPDLIIMDGGKGQVSAALKVLDNFDLKIPVCGLVKDDNHRTRGIIYRGREIELKMSSPVYRFLFSVQEEAHRFAINYHRKLREKNLVNSVLNEIPGVGKARQVELLKYFKSVNNIKKANLEELKSVPKINENIAKNILEFFSRG